jgi:hypothetical protein
MAAKFVDVRERFSGKCWAPRAIRRPACLYPIEIIGAPNGTRTRVFAVKGRYLKFIIVRDGPQLSLIYKKLLFIEFNIVRD